MPKRVTGGIRNDKIRKLYLEALRQGWTSEIDGAGHVKMTNPRTGNRFWISSTSDWGSNGRNYANARAKARRAGLEI